jgi:hypothetical protein
MRPGAKEIGMLSQKFTRMYIVDIGSFTHLVVCAEGEGQTVRGYGFYCVPNKGFCVLSDSMVQLGRDQPGEHDVTVKLNDRMSVSKQLEDAGAEINGTLAHFRDFDGTSLIEWWVGGPVNVCTPWDDLDPNTVREGKEPRCFLMAKVARSARIQDKGYALYYPRCARWLRVIGDRWYWEKDADTGR